MTRTLPAQPASRTVHDDPALDKIYQSALALCRWAERQDYRGYEPFDGMSSALRPLTLGNWFAERVLLQLFLRSPWHIRPLLGVKKLPSTQGMGYFARGYLRLWQATGDEEWRRKAEHCLEWLIQNPSQDYSGLCWGNWFDSSARPFQLPRFAPTIVWTSHIGQAFLDAFEMTQDERYLKVAESICRFILKDLPRERTARGACLSYVTFKQVTLHNSNMLGADLLARTARHTGNQEAFQVAREAMEYSCSRQLENGAWYYGEAETYHWVDNWHTAYNLDSLKSYIEASGDRSWEANLERGYRFYKNHFFLDDGTPKYYYNRLFAVDIQSAAQAIDTLANFAETDPQALALARKVALWTIDQMQDRRGYFYYRMLSWKKVRIPMMHWGQSTMLSGLGHLLLKSSQGK